MRPVVVRAASILVDAQTWLSGAALRVERGVVVAILRTPAEVRRALRQGARDVDRGDALITAGLVNAHTHLELSGLQGKLRSGLAFGAWVRKLLELRARRTPRQRAEDARAGARRCLGSGTTCIADVDTTGAGEVASKSFPGKLVLLRELLDAGDPARTELELRRVARALPVRRGRSEGLAAHAPFSVSPALLQGIGRVARRRRLPISVHWSETEAEIEWLAEGTGPLAALLGPSPRTSGLDLLERAGLLGARTLLVHGNHPRPKEPARIAAAGATLVHCPGSHATFRRAPFPLDAYRRARVTLALGTDSLASNEDLDMQREMRLWRAAHGQLSPREVWLAATENGARALGLEDVAGQLRPGAAADWIVWDAPARSRAAVLEALTTGVAERREVWLGGAPSDAREARGRA